MIVLLNVAVSTILDYWTPDVKPARNPREACAEPAWGLRGACVEFVCSPALSLVGEESGRQGWSHDITQSRHGSKRSCHVTRSILCLFHVILHVDLE